MRHLGAVWEAKGEDSTDRVALTRTISIWHIHIYLERQVQHNPLGFGMVLLLVTCDELSNTCMRRPQPKKLILLQLPPFQTIYNLMDWGGEILILQNLNL